MQHGTVYTYTHTHVKYFLDASCEHKKAGVFEGQRSHRPPLYRHRVAALWLRWENKCIHLKFDTKNYGYYVLHVTDKNPSGARAVKSKQYLI